MDIEEEIRKRYPDIKKPKLISIIKKHKGKRLSIIKKLKKLRSTSRSIPSIGKKKQDQTSKNNGEKLVDFFSSQALRLWVQLREYSLECQL